MSLSPQSKSRDRKFIRRLEKLRPKARFKDLDKRDQYTISARTLSNELLNLRKNSDDKLSKLASGRRFTVRTIDKHYLEFDPKSERLTQKSVRRIKRAVANAFKAVLGSDAKFMFVIEQQDKLGEFCDPHIHALAILPMVPGNLGELRKRLQKIAGETDDETVLRQDLSLYGKLWNELSPGDAHFRRSADYDTKNDCSEFYRSKRLIEKVHAHFEMLKHHHRK